MEKQNTKSDLREEGCPISLTSIVVATKDQVSSDLGEESVILQLNSGIYYGLNGVGAHIWNMIKEPITVSYLKKSLSDEYEVDAEQCEKDLFALLQRLNAARLIEVVDEAVD